MWKNKNCLTRNFYIGLTKDQKAYEIIISAIKKKIFACFEKTEILVDYFDLNFTNEQITNCFKDAVSILDNWNIHDLQRENLNKTKIILKIVIFIIWVTFLIVWLSLVLHAEIH